MRKLAALILFTLALAATAGCRSGDDGGSGGGAEASPGTAVESLSDLEGGGGDVVVARGEGSASSLPELGPQVVQTATVRIAVRQGRFEEAVEEARSLTVGYGGFVVSSTAAQGSERRLERGTLVLRIPARSYADAMESLSGLGRVEAQNESGQDVSQEYVDLRGRTRHLEAVETQLLELLDRANTVGAALAVQQRLNQVQLDLEQARGRLQYLDDQVAFATISLALHEQLLPAARSDEGGFGIVEAWKKAGNAFLAVVGWTFVVLATIAPVLALLVLAFFVGRAVLRKRLQWPARRPA